MLPDSTQPPRNSLNPGLRAGWYVSFSSASAVCWLIVTGLISLALTPWHIDVDAQPVESTTVIPSTTVSNAARVISFKNTPEQRTLTQLPLLNGLASFIMCRLIFIQ
jgi:hypothetical protein